MNKYKILMVAPTPFPGNRGTPSRILDMSMGLSRLGHDLHVVSYHLKTQTPTDGITVHRIPKVSTYKKMGPGPSVQKLLILDPLLAMKVWNIASRIDFDVIHAHSFEGFLAALPAAKLKKKILLYDAHSTLSGELPSYDFINIKWLSDLLDVKIPEIADHIVCVSSTLRDFLLKTGINQNKLTVIPTGVNIQQFENHSATFIRKKYRISSDKKIFMYTGSLANFQGIDFLIEAAKKVFEKIDNALLILVGNSNEKKYLTLCKSLGIADKVLITGDRPFQEVPLFLAAADVVVIPRAQCPGIPQKLTNYMAAAKAIVSFEGSAKLLEDGVNGFVVENGDTERLAMKIIDVLLDAQLGYRLGNAAKKTIQGRYDWATLTKELENVYEKIL